MIKKIEFLIIIPIILSFPIKIYSQNYQTGKVIDAYSKEPLAFVNIVYNSKNFGTTTDIDGYFKISEKNNIEFLKISYLGYRTKIIQFQDIHNKSYIEIFLEPETLTLKEVIVFPGENPAHRIINKVIENSDQNNPEKVRSFTYTSYNKMYFTFDNPQQVTKDSSIDETNQVVIPDSTKKTIYDLLNEQYLFLTESVTERHYLYPDNNKEIVLAHRISGLKNPTFTLLTNQFQSFSFYNDFVNILDKQYLSPISKNSTKRYLFLIEDTIFNENSDTIFIISFRPRKGTNFDGLQGFLHINTNGYAIQSVIAKPYESSGNFNINIQQKYELIDEKQWFPVQLNTDLIFNFFSLSGDTLNITKSTSTNQNSLILIGIGKSYIYDINLNPAIKRKDFNQMNLVIRDNAHKMPEEFWNFYRKEKLTQKEIKTYQIIDSIGKEAKLDRTLEIIEILLEGYVPIYIFNVDLSSVLWYNQYEKYRLGLGINTNKRFSKYFSLGGYFAYGLGDKASKYGIFTDFYLNKSNTTRIRLAFKQDLIFSDDLCFNHNTSGFAQQDVREFFLTEMDSVRFHLFSFKFNALKYLNADLRLKYSNKNIINTLRYNFDSDVPKNIRTLENGLYLRYAYKEKFIQTPKGNRISLGTKYPVLFLNLIQGKDILNNKMYYKLETMLKFKKTWISIGETNLTVITAYTSKNTPYSGLYYGLGSFSWLSIYNSFNTMRINEFISDRFVSCFLSHNFGSLLFKTKKWKPKIELFTSAGWGDNNLILGQDVYNISLKMNKVFFESGIAVNNIIKVNFLNFGFAAFYRYGHYAFSQEINNWSFKLTYNIAF